MKHKQAILNKRNGGLGFVTLISNMDVKKVISPKIYKKLICETLTENERLETKALQWKI